jgi:hypothetical protein
MAAYLSDFGYYAERFLGNKVITAEYGGGNKSISVVMPNRSAQ